MPLTNKIFFYREQFKGEIMWGKKRCLAAFSRGVGRAFLGALVSSAFLSTVSAGEEQWSEESLKALVPKPLSGWSASATELKMLKPSSKRSGMEIMTGTSEVVTETKAGQPLRYRLDRKYQAKGGNLEVALDSDDAGLVSLVLTVHGYSHIEGDKPVPLPKAKESAQKRFLKQGFKPVMQGDNLAVQNSNDQVAAKIVHLGRTGSIMTTCFYKDCLGDIEALLQSADLARLDAFARFDHRATK